LQLGGLLPVAVGLPSPLLLVADGALTAMHVVAAPASVNHPAKKQTRQRTVGFLTTIGIGKLSAPDRCGHQPKLLTDRV
jgi:hypothetical protein